MKRYLMYLLALLLALLFLGCTGVRDVDTTVPDVTTAAESTTLSDSTSASSSETTAGVLVSKSNEELIDELIQQIKSALSE